MTIKILAVDDSQTMRQALEISFGGEDAQVVTLERGNDVVAKAKAFGPDVILVDARLGAGDLSGAQVCGAIRAEASLAQTPIVWMMPEREGVTDEKAKNVGANVAFGKPYESQRLLDAVYAACNMQASPRVQAAASAAPKFAAGGGSARSVQPPSFSGSKAPPRPKPTPSVRPSTPAAPAASAASPASVSIPVAVPIPFTSAASPTPGMLARIEKAMQNGGATAQGGVSAEAMKALAALSHDVVERIAWEVVPELAESILRERSASQ